MTAAAFPTLARITRALKAWKAAGYPEPLATIRPDGTIVLAPKGSDPEKEANDWDQR